MPNDSQAKSDDNEIDNNEEKVFDPGIKRILWGAGLLLIALLVFTFAQRTGRIPFFTENFLSLVVLVVIAIQAYIYRGQWNAMRAQLREIKNQSWLAKESIKMAEQSSIYANRAYVVAKIRDISERDSTLQFRLRIQNGGNTPANNVIVLYAYGLREKPPHEETADGQVVYDEGFTETERLGLIGPKASYHVISTPEYSFQSPAEFQQFDLGQLRFYCWGKIVYEDMFNRKRHSTFCFFQSPGQHAYGYPCKYGNEAY